MKALARIVGAIFFVLPLGWMIYTSLSENGHPAFRLANFKDALSALPAETHHGLTYFLTTLILAGLNVVGVLLSSSMVAYGFARLRFPGRDRLFILLLATMMLPSAVTLLPTFLLYRSLGWVDTWLPLIAPSFFAGAFNVFFLRQLYLSIPQEQEDAAKIDGCSPWQAYRQVMTPQIKAGLAVLAVWTVIATWKDFFGPLIYLNSPEKMPLSYGLQLFQGDHGGESTLMMAFALLTILPILILFCIFQRKIFSTETLLKTSKQESSAAPLRLTD